MDEHVFQKTTHLFQNDASLSKSVCRLIVSILGITDTKLRNDLPVSLSQACKISGSCCEGAISARAFFKESNTSCISRELEADLETVIGCIPPERKDLVQDIENKKGFARIVYHEEMLDFIADDRVKHKLLDKAKQYHVANEDNFIRPYAFKEAYLFSSRFRNSDRNINKCVSILKKVNEDAVTVHLENEDIKKASVETQISIFIHDLLFLKVSWDFTMTIRIGWWPAIAGEWKTRARKWPSLSIIEEATSCSYIIAKPSDEDKYDTNSTQLRYSFAHVEHLLVSKRSDHQNVVYFIFKALIYKWLKPIDTDYVSSFLGKTVMFWYCEEEPPTSHVWKPTASRTLTTLHTLLTRLLDAIRSGCLPYYFIPDINIIESMPLATRDELAVKIEEVLSDMNGSIPSADVISQVDSFVNEMKKICDDALEWFSVFDVYFSVISRLPKK